MVFRSPFFPKSALFALILAVSAFEVANAAMYQAEDFEPGGTMGAAAPDLGENNVAAAESFLHAGPSWFVDLLNTEHFSFFGRTAFRRTACPTWIGTDSAVTGGPGVEDPAAAARYTPFDLSLISGAYVSPTFNTSKTTDVAQFAVNTISWTGAGASNVWGDANNWGGTNVFTTYGTVSFSGTGGAQGTTSVVNGSINQNTLFWGGSSAWILNNSNGAVISLFDDGGVQAKIENQSSGSVTINAPLTFAATAGNRWGEINAVNGDIAFGSGTLAVNGTGVDGIKMFGSGHSVTFNNTVSASGKYFSTSAIGQIVNIGGSFTSGDFYLMNSGTLKLNAGATFTTSGSTGAALRLGGDFGATGTQNLALGATLQLTPLTGGLMINALINTVSNNTSGALLIDSQNTSGINTLAGDFYLDSDLKVQQATGGTLLLSDTTLDLKNQTMTVLGSGTVSLSGVVGNSVGSGKLTLGTDGTPSTGTLRLSSANTYTGNTTIRAGTLEFAAAGARSDLSAIRLGSSSGIGVNAAINLSPATGGLTIGSIINPVATSGSGLLTLNSQNTSGTNIYTGHIGMDRNFTITQSSGGQLNITQARTDATTTTSGTDIKGFTLSLQPSPNGIINITGDIYNSTGSGSLAVSGGGTVILAGGTQNTFSGGVTVIGATLQVGTTTGLGSGAVSLNDAAIFNNTVSLTNQGRLFNLTAAANASVTFNTGQTLSFASSGTRGLSGGSSTLTLVKNGSGTITATDAGTSQSYLGNWRIDAGVFQTSSDAGLGNVNNDVTLNGGTFRWLGTGNYAPAASRTFTFNSIAGNTIDLSSSTASLTFAGTNQLTGSGGVSITGAATNIVTISGAQNFTGGFSFSAGTLSLGNDSALGTGTISLGSGSTVQSTDAVGRTIGNAFNGTLQSMTFGTSATGDLAFTNTSSVSVGSTAKTLTVNNSLTTLAATLTSTGSVVKAGSGTLSFTGANTYSGGTAINAGTFLANNTTGSATGTGAVTANGSGTTLGGTGTITGTVTLGNTTPGAILNPGSKGTAGTSASVGTLTTGALTLTGANTVHIDAFGTSTTQWDKLVSTGAISLGSTSALELSIASGLNFTAGTTYVLLTGNSLAGTFSGIVDNQTYTFSGYDFMADYTATSFNLVAIPEPGTWAAAAVAAGILGCQLLVVRRRKRLAERLG